jgi:hypothetical protein
MYSSGVQLTVTKNKMAPVLLGLVAAAGIVYLLGRNRGKPRVVTQGRQSQPMGDGGLPATSHSGLTEGQLGNDAQERVSAAQSSTSAAAEEMPAPAEAARPEIERSSAGSPNSDENIPPASGATEQPPVIEPGLTQAAAATAAGPVVTGAAEGTADATPSEKDIPLAALDAPALAAATETLLAGEGVAAPAAEGTPLVVTDNGSRASEGALLVLAAQVATPPAIIAIDDQDSVPPGLEVPEDQGSNEETSAASVELSAAMAQEITEEPAASASAEDSQPWAGPEIAEREEITPSAFTDGRTAAESTHPVRALPPIEAQVTESGPDNALADGSEAETSDGAGEEPAPAAAPETENTAVEGETGAPAEVEPAPVDAGPVELDEPVFEPEPGPDEEELSRVGQPVRRYQPPRQKVPRPPKERALKQEVTRTPRPEETLEIRVHLAFDRFYFCTVSLLPERIADVEDDIEARDGRLSIQLTAQEDWYQDLEFGDIGEKLRNGLELRAVLPDKRQVRWLLTRREIYVLATHPRTHAYVSTNRLALGRSDAVLCVTEMAAQTEALLMAAGCQGYVKFGNNEGAPQGWTGFRGVLPSVPLPLDEGIDPFYPLKPAPDIEIALEGGVWLRNSAYLAGYPPKIKLYGQHAGGIRVFIDGREARLTPEGTLVDEGSEAPGPHNVLCEGLSCSRSYSIEEPPESWEPWAAYSFRQADICGPLIQPKTEAADDRFFSGPMSNPLLIGAVPGQMFRCSSRKAAVWKGYVPFDVVWALPGQPLACDKRTARIIPFGTTPPAPLNQRRQRTEAEIRWGAAILDAARKGLRIESASGAAPECWQEYKKIARNIRRSRR